MSTKALDAAVTACRDLIETRFPDDSHRGAAAVLLADGKILTGTSPDFTNPSTLVCHEVEPYCAAFRLGQAITSGELPITSTDASFSAAWPGPPTSRSTIWRA